MRTEQEYANLEAERIKALEAEHAKKLAIVSDGYNLLSDKIAKADAVVEAAIGLNFGEDWNKGTHAKIYRSKLRAAIEQYQKGE